VSHTIRNVEICRLLEQGVPIAEIAKQFNLSESTVKKMKYTVCKELEVSPREAMSVAKNVEEKVRELEQVVTELKIGFDMIRARLDNELASIKSSIDQLFNKINELSRNPPASQSMSESQGSPIEVGTVELPRFEIPRKVNLDTTTLMYYAYARALALKKVGKDLDLNTFINGTIRQFFEKCVGISLAVVRKEIGSEVEIPEGLEVEVGSEPVSESGSEGETHGEE